MDDPMFLDLTEPIPSARQPIVVKLPDGTNYQMIDPSAASAEQVQVLADLHRRLYGSEVAEGESQADYAEMLSAIVDVACSILPAAPREVVSRTPLPALARLFEAFVQGKVGER